MPTEMHRLARSVTFGDSSPKVEMQRANRKGCRLAKGFPSRGRLSQNRDFPLSPFYTSSFAYCAFVSMKRRRGST